MEKHARERSQLHMQKQGGGGQMGQTSGRSNWRGRQGPGEKPYGVRPEAPGALGGEAGGIQRSDSGSQHGRWTR